MVAGLAFSGTSSALQYQNGIDFHVDWATSKFIGKTVHVGLVGYVSISRSPATAASGPGSATTRGMPPASARRSDLLHRPSEGYTGYLNVRGYADIVTENRAKSTTFMVTPEPGAVRARAAGDATRGQSI